MTKTKTIEEFWQEFRSRVFHPQMTIEQERAAHRIFYAGAQCMFNLLVISEADLVSLQSELRTFLEKVKLDQA